MSRTQVLPARPIAGAAVRQGKNSDEQVRESFHELIRNMFAFDPDAPWCVFTILGIGLIVADIGDLELVRKAREATEDPEARVASDEYQLLCEYEQVIS